MKSVGEVMAIGRTFKEALWKGIRSLETGKAFGSETFDKNLISAEADHAHARPPQLYPLRLRERLHGRRDPRDDRDRSVVPGADAKKWSASKRELERDDAGRRRRRETLLRAKRYGISDAQLAKTWGAD